MNAGRSLTTRVSGCIDPIRQQNCECLGQSAEAAPHLAVPHKAPELRDRARLAAPFAGGTHLFWSDCYVFGAGRAHDVEWPWPIPTETNGGDQRESIRRPAFEVVCDHRQPDLHHLWP